MEKINFKNYPDTSTPLSAENLNLLQTNIENAINDMKKSLYSVGDLFMTTNEEDPNIKFGGTWRKLTDDAYLKIVSSNAGKTGGTSSEHKIPLTSIPSHTHTYSAGGGNYSTTNITGGSGIVPQTNPYSTNTGSSGAGNAYYPYYLGVYVWIKEAD